MRLVSKLVPVFIVIAIIGIAASAYFYNQYNKAQKEIQSIKSDPNILKQSAQQDAKKLLEEVGKLIDLPSGEEPTVATVTDIDKLKDQVFFQKAKNGDKVIIYTNAKKAILYDPKSKKILDVAPLNIGTPSASQAQVKVALRNGTKTVGLTGKLETELKKAFPNANILSKEDAKAQTYEKTIVVSLNDAAKASAEALAKSIKAEVSSLPAGEEKPENTDILIIVGKDKI